MYMSLMEWDDELRQRNNQAAIPLQSVSAIPLTESVVIMEPFRPKQAV